MAWTKAEEPFPVFRNKQRYLLFDIDIITHIRREHNICGVLIGNIPQASQQTVFSGIPLQLLPEEARLLVDQGHAFIVDDVVAHEPNLQDVGPGVKDSYLATLRTDGLNAAEAQRMQSLEKKRAFVRRTGSTAVDFTTSTSDSWEVTPTTSYPPLSASNASSTQDIPTVPSSYALFARLHSKGYFLGPGLRFGCQYVAYPGDPLRFHSHFLVNGHDWDEEIDLLDIVGGGRLGTGVKKAYLIGGAPSNEGVAKQEDVRMFSFEWAAM